AEVAGLPALEARLKENISQLNGIDRERFDEIEQRRNQLAAELASWEREQRELLTNQKQKEVQRAETELQVAADAEARTKDLFDRCARERYFSAWLPRIEELRS